MSSVEPEVAAAAEAPVFVAAQQPATLQRPHRAAYVLAAIMPVILLVALAVPVGVAWTIARLRQVPAA